MDNQGKDVMLRVRDLKKYFPVKKGGFFGGGTALLKAVDGISFDLCKGKTMGLVGESGCGKTTAGRAILRLIEPSGGEVLFEGRDLARLKGSELTKMRSKMQIVFQDPYASLNPRRTVGQTITEPMMQHRIFRNKESAKKRVRELLEVVGMSAGYMDRYPHEFSGGQRQRIGIARALALNPGFLVCDEPVSALDVSIQAQIINLLEDLQKELGLTYMFISHDLKVVRHISDHIGIMYLGKIVETGTTREIYDSPQHPYTKALLSAIPVPDPTRKTVRIILTGDVPSPVDPPPGCRFQSRCYIKEKICRDEDPVIKNITATHRVMCHLAVSTGLEAAEARRVQ